jgi:hypothetical protein
MLTSPSFVPLAALERWRRMPAPVVPVIRANVDFQIEFVPADGIRLPFSGSGDLGTSPFFGQLSVKVISLTVSQRTILVA